MLKIENDDIIKGKLKSDSGQREYLGIHNWHHMQTLDLDY